MTLSFTAYGVPQPKGSAKAFVPKGWTRAVVTSDNKKNKGWQQLVAEAASAAIAADRSFRLLAGPVRFGVRFFLPRPKSIKDKIVPHLTKPDADKLARSVVDSLTGVVWGDDKQVVELHVEKRYAEPGGGVPRAEVMVTTVGPVRLQDGLSPEWTCATCGGDALWCGHR